MSMTPRIRCPIAAVALVFPLCFGCSDSSEAPNQDVNNGQGGYGNAAGTATSAASAGTSSSLMNGQNGGAGPGVSGGGGGVNGMSSNTLASNQAGSQGISAGGSAAAGNVGNSTGSGGESTGGADSTGGVNTSGNNANSSGGGPTGASGGAAGQDTQTSNGSGGMAGASSSGGSTAGADAGGTSGMGDGGSGGVAGDCSGPVGTFEGALAAGIRFMDTDGEPVNAHGGGVVKVDDTFYMHGELFLDNTTDNNFHGVAMYSSQDLSTWKNEGVVLPTQASGELGPNRKGERPHIIQCPATGEFVMFVHAASEDYQMDKEIVYATSDTVNGQYAYQGPLTNSGGAVAAHSDMSALTDGDKAYMITESGHVYSLAGDCHSWTSDDYYPQVNGDSGGSESPTVFKAGDTYYWIGSYKTGWRANNNFYSTAPAMSGPWTYQGFVAPVADPNNNLSDERTWLSQSTWVTPVAGCNGTVYVYWGDHWDGNQDTNAPGRHNYLATYVFQPLVFDGIKISMPEYHETWTLDVGHGEWSP